MNQQDNIITVKGIGEKTCHSFFKLGIYNLRDLITYYPRDYDQFSKPETIALSKPNQITAIRITGLKTPIVTKKVRNLSISNMVATDGTGEISISFFNMPYLKNVIDGSKPIILRGRLQERKERKFMEQPKIYKEEDYVLLIHTLQPSYSLTKGITNHMITKAVRQVLTALPKKKDYLSDATKKEYHLIDCMEAIYEIHFPTNYERLIEARRRLVFDEFFFFLLTVRKSKEKIEALRNETKMLETAEENRLLEHLPYSLTNAQKKVWNEIKEDLMGEFLMNRLVQGDVGSGKTILAAFALLMCAANGYQGALMAPTEVLAKQHYDSMMELTKQYELSWVPILLTGSMTSKEKRIAYERIEKGEANLIIGTHALIQEKVRYQKLALVVTDEQHRFGVRQREALAGKGEQVHVLVMSATPIPRTLAIILYGDLHLSILDELPAERLPIKNCVVNTGYRPKAYAFLEKEVKAGRQAYVICPMVEAGELEALENVMDYTETLRQHLSDSVSVAYLHGKLKASEKNRIMEEFLTHNIDVLVSTTVIEVGINVPNATVMMIENAERFGLAQLHQLRGRVGRGKEQSYCIFVSSNESNETLQRLNILNQSNDGFFIAGEDLKLRGPGDIFGIRQSGILDFKMGDIYQDADLLNLSGNLVDSLLLEDFELALEKNQIIREQLEENSIFVDFRSI